MSNQPETTTRVEFVSGTLSHVVIRTTVTTTARHSVTPLQWQALDALVRRGPFCVTGGGGWVLPSGTDQTAAVVRRLARMGLAECSVNTYSVTEAGRLAHANVENRRRALPRK